VTRSRVRKYQSQWRKQGYSNGIPDEVPHCLMRLNLAPSWRGIALAILNNDLMLSRLGFSLPQSAWYGELKRMEFDKTKRQHPQMDLFR